MKPLYDARIGDVLATPGAAVVATCHHCGHASSVPVSILEGRSPMSRVVTLEPRLRCTECGHRGATLRVEWPAAAAC
jgi:hypothetical protein